VAVGDGGRGWRSGMAVGDEAVRARGSGMGDGVDGWPGRDGRDGRDVRVDGWTGGRVDKWVPR
jgi:hypothetical protein